MSSFADTAPDEQIPQEVLMLTQEELVIYPSPDTNPITLQSEKLTRFPLSQILSNNHVLLMEKISAPAST